MEYLKISIASHKWSLLTMNAFTQLKNLLFPVNISAPIAFSEKKTLLIIDDYIPYHDKSSGSKRLFELLKLFKALDFELLYFPEDGKAPAPYAADLQNIGVEILINTAEESHIDQLKKRLNQINYAWISRPTLNQKYQKILNKQTKTIFDTVDLHYLRMLRQAEKEGNIKLEKKALKTKKLELSLALSSNATVTVTENEKYILENEGIENVFVIPNIHIAPHIDEQPDFEQRNGILFIGGYKHEPNIDAVRWLVNEIMPKVWETAPEIKLTLLGSDPTEEIMAFNSEKILVPGYIKDVSSYFCDHRIFVAPLRYGAGMKGKIGQSLEYGLPVVSTDIGVEGMSLIHGTNVMLAENTTDFAGMIIELYSDVNLWKKVRSNSIQAIENYSPKNVTEKLTELFGTLGHHP